MNIKYSLKISALLNLVILFIIPACGLFIGSATRCYLNQTCDLNHGKQIYLAVTAIGNSQYQCNLSAKKLGESVLIKVEHEKNSMFETATYTGEIIHISIAPRTTKTPWHNDVIKFTNNSFMEDGQVTCSQH